MITSRYVPIIKTGEAELRALLHIDEGIKRFILPLFEITRGRKTKTADRGVITKKVEFITNNFNAVPFILDLTGDTSLSNLEIEQMQSSENNYYNWINFCISNKENFGEFYPVVQIEEEDIYDNYISKLYEQVKMLLENFNYIVFRSQDEKEAQDLITDIAELKSRYSNFALNLSDKVIYVLDYKYIRDVQKCSATAKTFIKAISDLGIRNIILSSTAFPTNISEHMNGQDYQKFKIKEIDLYNLVKSELSNNFNLIYSDYASINPIRNDNTKTRGWIPRIDVPSTDKYIHCMRKRRNKEIESYAKVYERIAIEVIIKNYYNILQANNILSWGNIEIKNAANGNVGGAVPNYWISVRMNIYLKLMSMKLMDFIS